MQSSSSANKTISLSLSCIPSNYKEGETYPPLLLLADKAISGELIREARSNTSKEMLFYLDKSIESGLLPSGVSYGLDTYKGQMRSVQLDPNP